MNTDGKLLVVDSHAIIHRGFHAIPPLTTTDGTPTNAVYGFFSMMHKVCLDIAPTHIVFAFDTPTDSFRKQMIPSYQETRPPAQPMLVPQFSIVKELLDANSMIHYESPGYEADDTIGTIIHQSHDHFPQIIILTGDKDMLQLVDTTVSVLTPQIGFSKSKLYTPSVVEETIGVLPMQIPDYKALCGDASDNYGGIPGIGPKTATKLIKQYHYIEQMRNIFSPTTFATLEKAKRVATIVCNISTIVIQKELLCYNGWSDNFREKLQIYELYSLVRRYTPRVIKKQKITSQSTKDVLEQQESLF